MTAREVNPGTLHQILEDRLATARRARVAAPPRTKRRRGTAQRAGTFMVAVVTILTILASGAIGAHDFDLLELDADSADGGGPGTDWDALFSSGGAGADAYSFVADGFDQDSDDVFTIGGTKDHNDVPAWHWKNAKPSPDKNDIEFAMAAAFTYPGPAVCPDGATPSGDPAVDHSNNCTLPGDLILYFAADRFAVDGNVNVGFWFFQNGIGKIPPGDPADPGHHGGNHFAGMHRAGDIFVLSEFTNGGTVPFVKVWQWVDSGGDIDPNLDEVFVGVDCQTAGLSDPACARVNTASPAIDPAWGYDPKGPNASEYPAGAFIEGGVNLSALGVSLGCVSSFLAETRSSQSVSSILHDFALGDFDVCELTVTKEGDDLSKVGDLAHYTVTIANDSAGVTLYKESVIDSVFGDITDGAGLDPNLSGYTSDCGASLTAGTDCTIEFDYEVQPGDPDPLNNTVTATYNDASDLTGSQISDADDHSLDLFQPSVTIDKSGTTLSKVGDDVTYDYTITNTSSNDSPNLILDSLTDSGDNFGGAGLGDLTADADYDSGCDELAPGDSCSFSIVYTVQSGDDDPLDNTVVVHYHPDGFPNDITDEDSHSVNLFQPAVTIDKTGDELSKVGDDVNYTITVTNTSSSDSPNLTCAISDALIGLSKQVNLAPGDIDVSNETYTVQSGDPDPLLNTASVTCTVDGFGNVIGPETDDHSVALFEPAVEVIKDGPAQAGVGDLVTYSFTINNLSSSDAPNLILVSVTDTVLGDLTAAATTGGCGSLGFGASCAFTADYTIQAGDPNPLVNVVTVLYNPDGFPNEITDSDDHSLEIVGGEGCTPGFWQGGFGINLWDEVLDTDWGDAGGSGFNPFETDTIFGTYFPPSGNTWVDGHTMLDIVGTGGTNVWARKAARDLIAAYLNSSFGLSYPYSTATILSDWTTAVADGTSGFRAFHAKYSAANELGCDIGGGSLTTTSAYLGFGALALIGTAVGARIWRLRRRPREA